MPPRVILAFLIVALGAAAGCADPVTPPNILWIVWDTVRADHLGVYGYERPTTPNLARWAAEARVYEDCVSAAGYTLPSHASMFTGLLPSEHCTDNASKRLDDRYTTLAEILRSEGYRTFLFSANPHVSEIGNLAQGFESVAHPWSPEYAARALEIVKGKLPAEDVSSELGARFEAVERREARLTSWNVKAAGELAGEALAAWAEGGDSKRPYFAFLNYMEAHRPYIPARSFREQLMTPEQVARSYEVDRSWTAMWEYTFGLREYTEEEIELTRATYDATLLELDRLFADLIADLEAQGLLENTVVVLTSDHGEHLGEQHMLDHQYSLYQPLLRVPLILHYPQAIAAGRDDRPVMNFDLFPTLLELAGIEPAADRHVSAVSLLDRHDGRIRIAEDPSSSQIGTKAVQATHPDFDPTPWQRKLRALVQGDDKLIWGSDGREQLFDLASDPLERTDLAGQAPARLQSLRETLEAVHASLRRCDTSQGGYDGLSPEQLELLKSLGYVE